MVEEKINAGAFFFPHADLNTFGNFEEWMEVAHLAQPENKIVVKMLVALGADVNGLAEAEGVHRQGGAPGVKILHIGRENLAALRLNEVAPELGGMHVARGEYALEGEMVFLAG